MELALEITSYQRLSPTVQTRKRLSQANRYVIGRGKDCDWHLPDPDRIISSRHAEVHWRDGQFWLKDISTNGIILNAAAEPVGHESEVALKDGDSLKLGDYEVSVKLGAPSGPVAPLSSSEPQPAPVLPPVEALPISQSIGSGVGDVPIGDGMGGNPTLASGLQEQRMGDSHVEIPEAIPPVWNWNSRDQAGAAPPDAAAGNQGDLIQALFDGMGMPRLAEQSPSPALMRDIGDLTRILLEHLLDLLHRRAEQKQKLRVQQTLFQRSENNPLKFSATAQDAIEALLVRRHGSFLESHGAVSEAFTDIQAHERALMAGMERVVGDLLEEGKPVASTWDGIPLVRKARAHESRTRQLRLLREEFGDIDRILRSDAFVDAYEKAIQAEQE